MKITNEHVARLLAARLQQVRRPTPPTGAQPQRVAGQSDRQSGSDRAVFSSVAEDLRVGLAAARRAGPQAPGRPDSARLTSLAAQVKSGRYHVSADQIADALARELRGA